MHLLQQVMLQTLQLTYKMCYANLSADHLNLACPGDLPKVREEIESNG